MLSAKCTFARQGANRWEVDLHDTKLGVWCMLSLDLSVPYFLPCLFLIDFGNFVNNSKLATVSSNYHKIVFKK